MHGKRRGLNEVGVMGRVTMKGWSVGCNERQMGGGKENTIHTLHKQFIPTALLSI